MTTMPRLTTMRLLATAALFTATAASASADCPVTQKETQEILRAFPAAQAAEKANRPKDALVLYAQAQGYLCDGNPNAAAAARRAAVLAPPLAKVAEQQGAFEEAFELYEQGGHYAAADRALMALLRQRPDDVALVGRYITHFENRALASFAENHQPQIAAAGAYGVDAALRTELAAMPAKGIERALAKEKTSFDERYLAERMRLVQSRPEPSPANMEAVQAAMAAEQAFRQKYPVDLVQQAQEQLRLARRWASIAPQGDTLVTQVDARTLAQAEARAATLAASYAGAPEFLEAAASYYGSVDHLKPAEARIAQLKKQASLLGDQARGRARYALAIDYYSFAGLSEKADATRAQQRQAAMQQMQPEIDAARKAAETIAGQFDPATVEALKRQAAAAQAAAAAAAAGVTTRPAARDKQTADMERELGLR